MATPLIYHQEDNNSLSSFSLKNPVKLQILDLQLNMFKNIAHYGFRSCSKCIFQECTLSLWFSIGEASNKTVLYFSTAKQQSAFRIKKKKKKKIDVCTQWCHGCSSCPG